MVRWRLFGASLMTAIGHDTCCLGFTNARTWSRSQTHLHLLLKRNTAPIHCNVRLLIHFQYIFKARRTRERQMERQCYWIIQNECHLMMHGSLEGCRTLFMKMTISFNWCGFDLSAVVHFLFWMLLKFFLFVVALFLYQFDAIKCIDINSLTRTLLCCLRNVNDYKDNFKNCFEIITTWRIPFR